MLGFHALEMKLFSLMENTIKCATDNDVVIIKKGVFERTPFRKAI